MEQTEPQLLAVSVGRVLRDIRTAFGDIAHVVTVMAELTHSSRYLEVCVDAKGNKHGKTALISYRVQRSPLDDFTLDPAAFISILAAAEENKIKFLWLDCWAYRKQPPWETYKHDDFCVTLARVTSIVDHVIWLPRSRAGCRGEYQYRLWCTFEASVVRLRELPVSICGYELSKRQLSLAMFGSMLVLPPWAANYGSEVEVLGKVNFFQLSASSVHLWTTCVLLYVTPAQSTVIIVEYVILNFFLISVYIFARFILADQVMLARNAKRVLSIMLRAAAARRRRSTELSGVSPGVVAKLTSTLPWLPAHDRRDVVTIKTTLDLMAVFITKQQGGSRNARAQMIRQQTVRSLQARA